MEISSSRITEFVGDDYYPCELRIKELRLLQSSLGSGPSAILDRLQNGLWLVDDLIETIRLGLIGGGLPDIKSKLLVDAYVTSGSLLQYVPTAIKILISSIVGNSLDQPDDAPGEPEAPTMTHDD